MTTRVKALMAASITGVFVSVGLSAQNPPAAPPQEAAAKTPVAIVGCVERVMPSQDDAGRGQTAPVYKLIETEPGGGSPIVDATGRTTSVPPKAPAAVDPQYWLAGPATMQFATYQNQRVEVIGTIGPAPRGTIPAAAAPPPIDAPKALLTAASIRVLSTECK